MGHGYTEIGLHSSELTYDVGRPFTVAMLQRFDPDLRLVWSKRVEKFQIMRVVSKTRHMWVNGFGPLAIIEPVLVWQEEWPPPTRPNANPSLLHHDDPWPLIAHLEQADNVRHPEKLADSWFIEQRRAWEEKVNKRVRENYRHATLSNLRQLRKVWEPVMGMS